MALYDIIPFLKELKKNNHKEWFDNNRSTYQERRLEMIDFVSNIINQSSKFDKNIEGIDPKTTLFRINKDVRFSKDKSPYKTNFGASISKGGKKSNYAGYYIHIEPGACFVGGGLYMPTPDNLKKIRQEIDYNGKELQKMMNKASFKKHYTDFWNEGKLVRPPKGYNEENPFIEWIKLKHFVVVSEIKDQDLKDKNFEKMVVEKMKALHPILDFLNTVQDES